jgi:hypothetical protein
MSEPTFGPWEHSDALVYVERVLGHPVFATTDGLPVAHVFVYGPDEEAKARLIAAAPDLLARCEALVDELSPGDGCNGCGWSYGHNDTCVVLAALLTIAKAKGAR